MSLLSWIFPKRRPAAPPAASSRPDRSRLDPAAVRKFERSERREWLYGVVRDAMLHAGILSSRYKVKALSLDERGRGFLVMVDLAREVPGDTTRLARIEQHIAHNAKARYALEVSAVYWRTHEHSELGRDRAATPANASAAGVAPPSGHFEPVQSDEIDTFRRALAGARAPEMASGDVRREADFEDTQMIEPDVRPDAPSHTPYGDLR